MIIRSVVGRFMEPLVVFRGIVAGQVQRGNSLRRSSRTALPASLVLLCCSIIVSGTSRAEGLDLALSNETANLNLILNPFSPRALRSSRSPLRVAPRGSELSIGAFVNEIGDSLLHATLMARGVNISNGTQYKLGAGMKAIGGDLEEVDEKVSALALGFQASVLLGYADTNPLDFTVEAFFAPGITSFSDAEQFSELAARLQVEVIGQARAYLGYRRISFDTNDFGEQRLDRGIHLGLNITF